MTNEELKKAISNLECEECCIEERLVEFFDDYQTILQAARAYAELQKGV